jgi:hypothetical protein
MSATPAIARSNTQTPSSSHSSDDSASMSRSMRQPRAQTRVGGSHALEDRFPPVATLPTLGIEADQPDLAGADFMEPGTPLETPCSGSSGFDVA